MQCFKIKKSKLFSICVSIILILIYKNLVEKQNDLHIECVISVSFLIATLFLLYIRYRKITGGMLFYICILIMHTGQIILTAFNLDFSSSLKSSIAISDIIPYSFEAIKITTILCLVIASTICIFENIEDLQKKNELIFPKIEIKLTKLGWCIITIVIVLTVISDLVRIKQVANVGYAYGYHQNNTILYYADFLFPLCYFLVITVYRNDWRMIRSVFFLVAIRDLYCAFLIGSRGEAVLDIIMCVFAISKTTTSTKIKNNIKCIFILSCIAGFLALPFTGLLRADKSLSFITFLKDNNPLVYSLTEFGGSIVNVRLALQNQFSLPISDFWTSFLSIVPMSTKILPNILNNYGGSYVNYLNIGFGGGLGGSVLGEAIFWFGEKSGALVYIFIYTLLVVLCMNKLRQDEKSSSLINNTVLLFLLYEMFYQIRGSISSFQSGLKILIYFWILMTAFKKYIFLNKNINDYKKGLKK